MLDLIDALTVAGQVSSPVALSEHKPFRRKFGSIYDGLENGELDIGEILSLLPHCVPEDSETIAGYKMYAVVATANEHEQSETLPDRSVLKSNKAEPMRYGHKYSWVIRLMNIGTSWVAPVDIERDNGCKSGGCASPGIGCARSTGKSHCGYEDHQFLGIFERLKQTFGLIRLHRNRVLFEEPKKKPFIVAGRLANMASLSS